MKLFDGDILRSGPYRYVVTDTYDDGSYFKLTYVDAYEEIRYPNYYTFKEGQETTLPLDVWTLDLENRKSIVFKRQLGEI